MRVEVDPALAELLIDELPADHLYRIAREAVKNALHHGACSKIEVRLRVLEEALCLEITDDGVGCDFAAGSDQGFGLRLMEYRARIIGATFEIGRHPRGGTAVRAQVRLWNVARRGVTEARREPTPASGGSDMI